MLFHYPTPSHHPTIPLSQVRLDDPSASTNNSPQDPQAIRDVVTNKFKHRTVPAIFIDGKLIGGNSDLQRLHKDGKLKAMLKL